METKQLKQEIQKQIDLSKKIYDQLELKLHRLKERIHSMQEDLMDMQDRSYYIKSFNYNALDALSSKKNAATEKTLRLKQG